MKNMLLATLTLTGCVLDPLTNNASKMTTADGRGCPLGEQPVFGTDPDELECAPIPEWPPPRLGSRSASAACALRDGIYSDIEWRTDHDASVRPAFSTARVLTIVSSIMVLSRPGFDAWGFNVDWVDAGTAFAWEAGDTDTWEFVVWRDCARETIRGTRTVNLPYYNPGHQVETWTFEVPDPTVPTLR